MKNIRDKSKLT